MTVIQYVGQLFADLWDIFSVPHPVLGISVGSIVIGVFVVGFSITILRPLLGIGGQAVNGTASVIKRSRANSYRKKQRDQLEQSNHPKK